MVEKSAFIVQNYMRKFSSVILNKNW